MSPPHASPKPLASQVLWGRVATAVTVIVLAFGLGRCTAGSVPESEVTALESQVGDLQSTNEQLQTQVDRLEAQASQPDTTSTTEPTSPSPTGSGTPTAPAEGAPGGIWTVTPGDTLYAIAIEVYGDRQQARAIADANGLETGATLQVGQVLQLPASR